MLLRSLWTLQLRPARHRPLAKAMRIACVDKFSSGCSGLRSFSREMRTTISTSSSSREHYIDLAGSGGCGNARGREEGLETYLLLRFGLYCFLYPYSCILILYIVHIVCICHLANFLVKSELQMKCRIDGNGLTLDALILSTVLLSHTHYTCSPTQNPLLTPSTATSPLSFFPQCPSSRARHP